MVSGYNCVRVSGISQILNCKSKCTSSDINYCSIGEEQLTVKLIKVTDENITFYHRKMIRSQEEWGVLMAFYPQDRKIMTQITTLKYIVDHTYNPIDHIYT
jgi:hypothetical protein